MYEYIDKNSTDTIKMELIVNASSADKKSLEAVENKHKGEFADRYGKRVLNKIQSKQTKKIEQQVKIETKDDLQERIKQLDTKFQIKDNDENKYYTTDKKDTKYT